MRVNQNQIMGTDLAPIAIESLNRVIRKTTKTRGSFPTDDAATKLIYLAIRSFEKNGRVVREWPLSDASIACR